GANRLVAAEDAFEVSSGADHLDIAAGGVTEVGREHAITGGGAAATGLEQTDDATDVEVGDAAGCGGRHRRSQGRSGKIVGKRADLAGADSAQVAIGDSEIAGGIAAEGESERGRFSGQTGRA